VELQAALPAMRAAGVWPVALSYDDRATLAAFAAERGITFPLLADEGSAVIRRLGLLNPTYPGEHERHGVAQPATYLVGRDGRVERAIVHASQTVRDAWPTAVHGLAAVAAAGGTPLVAGAPAARVAAAGVAATMALDTGVYRPRQRVGLRAVVEVAPGAHVYGRPEPNDSIPLTLAVSAPAGVTVEPVIYPPATPRPSPAPGAILPVYTGRVELAAHLIFEELREDAVIRATLRWQVCTSAACLAPEALAVELPITYRPPV
jgi:hypothetical protein